MYDSFHASETPNNRATFATFLHSTFNISRSEWLAKKMAPAVQALLRRFHSIEAANPSNPVVDDP